MNAWLAKMRQRGTVWMAVAFLLIGFIIRFIDSRYGIEMSLAGIIGVLSLLIIAFVVALAVLAVDNVPNKSRELIKLTISNWIVLIVVDLVAPLSSWMGNLFGL